MEQILQFHFDENRPNVEINGITGAGMSFFLSACCVKACRKNFRCKLVDYCDLLDELIILNRQEDLNKYLVSGSSNMPAYSYCLSMSSRSADTPRRGFKILYYILKLRDDLATSTLFICQYSPDKWGLKLSDEPGCYS